MSEENTFKQLSRRIEGLVARIETEADPKARADALNLAQSLMELHGAGLDRLMGIVAGAGASGQSLMNEFADDALVSSLLLLYGLHPHDLQTRVMMALEKTRPFLQSHGGDVELLGVVDGVVSLRLAGSCRSCPSSTMTLKLAIEQAIYDVAPDLTEIVTEGQAAPGAPARPDSLVQLSGSSSGHKYDECVSVGVTGQNILSSTVEGETHG